MARGMKIIACAAVILTAAFAVIYQIIPMDAFLTAAITAGTIAYHFVMRLAVGSVFDRLLHNCVDYNKKWFQVGETEQRLYKILRVKKWKAFLPTYDPNVFDKRQHTWDEIAQAMCQSELVHETIVLFSFLPIVCSLWFGATLVFVLTSVFSALFDLLFVMLQRYNRPRVLQLLRTDR